MKSGMLINLLWNYQICPLGWYKDLSFQSFVLEIREDGRVATIYWLDDFFFSACESVSIKKVV